MFSAESLTQDLLPPPKPLVVEALASERCRLWSRALLERTLLAAVFNAPAFGDKGTLIRALDIGSEEHDVRIVQKTKKRAPKRNLTIVKFDLIMQMILTRSVPLFPLENDDARADDRCYILKTEVTVQRLLLTLVTGFIGLTSLSAWAQADSLKTPNISANALFLYRNSDYAREDDSTTRNGVDIQEAELQFYSDIDPYTKLNFVLTVAPEYEVDPTTKQVTQKWDVSPEELWAESLQIPDVTLRIGKMKAPFGKHNLLHTHAFPFVDAPIINTTFLGDEGLAEVGVSAAWLMPLPWYSELSLLGLRQGDQNPEFDSPSSGGAIGIGHWKNLIDLSDSSTFEAGVSAASGKNYLRGETELQGADLTYKWRPTSGGKYHSLILAGEYMHRKLTQPASSHDQDGSGYNVWGQYQFAQRWAGLLRWEEMNIIGSDSSVDTDHFISNGLTQKSSASIVFSPSEFSSYRLEYDQTHGPSQPESGLTTDHKIYFQANFTIGSHPAHSY